jgi:hypothetical protein
MIKEHDCVVLTQDLGDAGLKAGDIGTVVHYQAGVALRWSSRRLPEKPLRRYAAAITDPAPGGTLPTCANADRVI